MAIQIRLYSRSRKSKWGTFLDFKYYGRITGKYTHTQGYEGAAQPWLIGDKISRKIKAHFMTKILLVSNKIFCVLGLGERTIKEKPFDSLVPRIDATKLSARDR